MEYATPTRSIKISPEQVNDFQRPLDGLELGSVSVRETTSLGVFADVSEYCLRSLTSATEETFDATLEVDDSNDVLFKKHEALSEYLSIAHLLSESGLLAPVLDPKDAEEDPRLVALREIIDDFRDEQAVTLADFHPNAPGSVDTLANFVAYYVRAVETSVDMERTAQLTQQYRHELIELVESPTGKRILGAAAAKKIAPVMRDIPIMIQGPLESLRQNRNKDRDILGTYRISTHTIAVDAMLHARYAASLSEPSEYADMLLKPTVFHELFHAVTDSYHMLRTFMFEDDYGQPLPVQRIESARIWPHFYSEAMVEILTKKFFAATKPPEPVRRPKIPERESMWRSVTSNRPRPILHDKAMALSGQFYPHSYPAERLLVDTIFEKFDWAAAGLSRRSAENLAVRAFFDTPDGTSRSSRNCHYLRQFNAAVSKASHPGSIQRLGTLVRIAGVYSALDLIESNKFDPHDRQAIPWVASKNVLNQINDWASSQPRMTKRWEDLRAQPNAFGVVVEMAQLYAERSNLSADAKVILSEGVVAWVALNYGVRRRQVLPDERFAYNFFGDKERLRTRHEPPSDPESARLRAEKLITWLVESKPQLLLKLRPDAHQLDLEI